MASNIRFGWQQAWLGFFALLYLVGCLVLVNRANLYVSPDETANRYFIEQFADTFSLKGEQHALMQEFDRLHPRSTLIVDGQVVPGSFLGLPFLYGVMAFIFGSWILWILTPALTLLAAHAWRRMTAMFFGESVGNIAFVLFLLHPAVWYYSSRGLMHNMLFFDVLVMSIWFWLSRPLGQKNATPSIWNELLSGLCLGLALFVRTSEVIWIVVILFAAAIIWWRSISWRRTRAFLFGLAVGIFCLLFWNTVVYGGPFVTGYTINTPIPAVTELSLSDSVDALNVLPFGIHPKSMWVHFSSYGVSMFWWLSLLALPGVFLFIFQKSYKRTLRSMMVLGSVIALWLVTMYGSWEIHDNPDPTQITMANSYVRYWLPMYVCTTPLIALTIHWLRSRGQSHFSQGLIVATLLIAVVGFNLNAVFLQGQDGLFRVKDDLEYSATIQASVLRYTEPDSVIIVDHADKIFFPHRLVWYLLRDEETYEAMPKLVEQTGLYYYGITFPQDDMDYLNGFKLKQAGLKIELVETYRLESLYRISKP